MPLESLYEMDKTPNVLSENKKFKSMRDTYNLTVLFLTLGMMHPTSHPRRGCIRLIIIGIHVVFVIIPCFIIIINDMRLRILNNDKLNFVRQLIIMVCLCFVFMKMILSIVRGKELKEIIDTISKDYERFNKMPEDYQEIAEEGIKKTKIFERILIVVTAIAASSYPVLAATFTIYSQLFIDTPKRHMIHECYLIFLSDEQRYLSPYFELYNAFAMYTTWLVFIGFTGFDGIFTVSIVHVSLKLRLISQDLNHLMDDCNDISRIKRKIGEFVDEHCEIESFIKKIQKCFEVWLVGVFFNAVLSIAMALSQTINKGESDINTYIYYFYTTATAVHIFLPCYLAADVAANVVEIGNFAYGCSWESIPDMRVRRSIAMIMNKAQVPIKFRALGMLTFNMELYLKTIQTSYTMFTILRK